VSFTAWMFLLGGFAVVGPIVAHLLAKPRFKRIPFTMLRFLRSGQKESQSRRKLRDILILLLRCAIIVLIAILFAQPVLYLRPKGESSRKVYYLGLDNSMSMAYSDGSERYLDKLIRSASKYIQAAENNGVFHIYPLAENRWMQDLSKEQALAAVKGLTCTAGSAQVNDFLSVLSARAHDRASSERTCALLVSDFTPHTMRQLVYLQEPARVHAVDYEQIVSPKPIDNAAITAAHVTGIIDDKVSIKVTVVNYGQLAQNRVLTAKAEGNECDSRELRLSPGERRVCPVQIDVGGARPQQVSLPIELSLSAGDGLREDDLFYLGVSIPQQTSMSVLLAGSSPDETFLLKTALHALSRMSTTDTIRNSTTTLNRLTPSDLDSADVLICSAITEPLGRMAYALARFVSAGGRVIFFLTEPPNGEALAPLWQQALLPAQPRKNVRQSTRVDAKPCDDSAAGVDNLAAKALANYRIDQIAFDGYWDCDGHPRSKCLWKFENGPGFVYLIRCGAGTSILVNTSVDDSLGSLTKSSASVAFCRYLLGTHDQLGQNCFAYGEPAVLPVPEAQMSLPRQEQIWVETCRGEKRRVPLSESCALVPDPGGIGWIKTLGKPTVHAGINLPDGETDMRKADAAEVANVMGRVFESGTERQVASTQPLSERQPTPLWRIFAWIVIVLLMVEPAVANRLKR